MGEALITRRGGGLPYGEDNQAYFKSDEEFYMDKPKTYTVSGNPFLVLVGNNIYTRSGVLYEKSSYRLAVDFDETSVTITYYDGVAVSSVTADVVVYYTP